MASTPTGGVTGPSRPVWRLTASSLAWRLLFTCWIVYGLHFATDVVREHYPAVALADDFTFRLDEYGGLHPDLFEKPGYGWHIGNNPGVSIFAAVPYFLARPVIDRVVARVQASRVARGDTVPPAFESPRTRSEGFFAEAYRRGLDVKLGLAALVTHSFFMAPASALGVVLVFFALRYAVRSDRTALWLALLYGFGTPVFFRTGFLNHNLMLGHIAFAGFFALWNPGGAERPGLATRHYLAGLAGGIALLFDYSGVVLLLGLFTYALAKRLAGAQPRSAFRHGSFFVLGTLAPVFLLWFYQWRAFGNPFLPGQHWMPTVRYIELGYQGYSMPQAELLLSLGFDPRFGIFVTAPLLLLGLAAPLLSRSGGIGLPRLEKTACLLLFLALWIFFAGNNYSRLQWNTGVRYMTAALPFLFLPAAVVLLRLRRSLILGIAILSVTLNWCMAMNREVWRPIGVLGPVANVFTSGFQLPALTTLSRMEMFRAWVPEDNSPLPLLVLAGTLIWLIWSARATSEPRGPRRIRSVDPAGRPMLNKEHEVKHRHDGPVAETAGLKGPDGSQTSFRVDVVIPVLNEAHVLEKSVDTVRAFLAGKMSHQWRIIIIDNGSTDGTDRVARTLTERHDDVVFMLLSERGRGRALRHAWSSSDADVVCYTDVDLSTELPALPKLVDSILYGGYDLATGSRLMRESRTRRSFRREVISRSYNLMVKAVLRTSFSDAQCGFKAVSREVVDTVVPHIRDESWFFDTELLTLSEKWGYRINDVPVEWIEDDDSRVKIIRTAWDDIKGICRVRWFLWWSPVARRMRAAEPGRRTDAREVAAVTAAARSDTV